MHRNQWKTASEQLLKHWQRSGISHIPSNSPGSDSKTAEWMSENATFVFEEMSSTETAPLGPVVTQVPHLASSVKENSPAVPLATKMAASVAPARAPKPPIAEKILEKGRWNSKELPPSELESFLHTLNEQVNACRKCEEIVCRRQRTVFGTGSLNARVAMFGEAPGAEEDRVGEPFVGAAGQLLDKILAASGLKRPEVYILNALKCRPPNNRTPTETEIENCRPFFEAQLEAIQPEYIVCWGSVAVRAVLKSTESVGRLRGTFHAFRGAKVMVTYHPAYLLRNPDAKRLTWEDMKMLIKEMGLQIPGPSTGTQ